MYIPQLITRWSFVFNYKPVSTLVSLYSKDAVLYPTFEKDMLNGEKQINRYFEDLQKQKTHVRLGKIFSRTAFGTDIEFGEYDFIVNGIIYKARFNMVTAEESGRMKIIFHQSTLIK